MNHAIEGFVRHVYGHVCWADIAARIGLEDGGFRPFRHYDPQLLPELISVASDRLDKPEDELLEDVGAWLTRVEAVRRLLRFSGSDYSDFVLALEELPGRAKMVLPDLDVPAIQVEICADQRYRVRLREKGRFWRPLVSGLVRAMSDDYGALALIIDEGDAILVDVSDASFGEGRDFDLGAYARGHSAW